MIIDQHKNSEYMKNARMNQARSCNKCGITKPWIYSGRNKHNQCVYRDNNNLQWNGGKCSDCHRSGMREYERNRTRKAMRKYELILEAREQNKIILPVGAV